MSRSKDEREHSINTHFRTEVYFDTLHHCFPMINRTRFRSMLPFLGTTREMASLSHAIWLHAASLVPEKHAQWEDHCYRSARHHLEKTETEDNSGTFMSIDTLQATILIALYEFKQMYFARAWLTIGKAMVRPRWYLDIAHAYSFPPAPRSDVWSSQDGWTSHGKTGLWLPAWAAPDQ